MIRSNLKGQRGGVAILTSLGFLVFSVPLITGSLGLAQTTNIDARVKTDVMHRDYCGLALKEYIKYLLMDTSRWVEFLVANVEPSDPTKVTATVDVCGEDITLTVTQQDPNPDEVLVADPLPTIPNAPAYKQRDFQTYKTVSDSKTEAGKPVTYTITAINRSDQPTTLREIHDVLPAGFSYDCSDPPDQLTLPGLAHQDIIPYPIPCPAGSAIQWDLPPTTTSTQAM